MSNPKGLGKGFWAWNTICFSQRPLCGSPILVMAGDLGLLEQEETSESVCWKWVSDSDQGALWDTCVHSSDWQRVSKLLSR